MDQGSVSYDYDANGNTITKNGIFFHGPPEWPDTKAESCCIKHNINLQIELAENGFKNGEWFCKSFKDNGTAHRLSLKHFKEIVPQLHENTPYGFNGTDGYLFCRCYIHSTPNRRPMKRNGFIARIIVVSIVLLFIGSASIPSVLAGKVQKENETKVKINNDNKEATTTISADPQYYAIIAACSHYENPIFNIPKFPSPPFSDKFQSVGWVNPTIDAN